MRSKAKKKRPYTMKIFTFCDQVKFKEFNLSALIMRVTSKKVCLTILTQTLQLIHKTVLLNISMGRYNKFTDDALECLLEILQQGNFVIKCIIAENYMNLLRKFKFYNAEMPVSYVKHFHLVISGVDCWMRRIYVKKMTVKGKKLERFEKILISLFCYCGNLENSRCKMNNITSFLVTKETCKELRCICLNRASSSQLSQILKTNQVINEHLQDMLENGNYSIMNTLRQQILNEITQHINTAKPKNSFNVVTSNASRCWKTVHEIFNTFLLFQCVEECCQIIRTLTFLHNLLDMMIYINIEVQNYCIYQNNGFLQCYFFNELSVLSFILKIVNTHMDCCTSQNYNDIILNELIMKIFSKLPITYSVTCINFVFNCIAFPFNKVDRDIRETYLSVNREFHELVKTFSFYLMRLQFTEEMAAVHLQALVQYISLGLVRLNTKTKEFQALQDIYTGIVKRELCKDTVSFLNIY